LDTPLAGGPTTRGQIMRIKTDLKAGGTIMSD
jgi:hypothetical protein